MKIKDIKRKRNNKNLKSDLSEEYVAFVNFILHSPYPNISLILTLRASRFSIKFPFNTRKDNRTRVMSNAGLGLHKKVKLKVKVGTENTSNRPIWHA
jgi:hypothetical protein